ncbi:MAG: hypothetical protein ACREBC_32100, partial [Pyrinomonadaceae bacterium]
TDSIGTSGYDLGAGTHAFDRDDAKARYFRLGAGGQGNYQGNGTNGSDGGSPDPSDYEDAYEVIDREIDIFNLLILPKDRDQTEDTKEPLGTGERILSAAARLPTYRPTAGVERCNRHYRSQQRR